MNDIVEYFVECLLKVKNSKPIDLEYNNKNSEIYNKSNKLSFKNKYVVHQRVNQHLNNKFNDGNLEQMFVKYKC